MFTDSMITRYFNLDEIETDESENVNYIIYSNEEIEKILLKLEEEK